MNQDPGIIQGERIESRILLIRGQNVMLDFDLATLYGVSTKVLNQAVRRNPTRFPRDFMFQLSRQEWVTILRSQYVTSSSGHGGRRNPPCAFTEQGVAMLSGVLNSTQAIRVNVEIIRTFVRLRQWLVSNAELARKLDAMERKYDEQFRVVFEAIRQLMKDGESAEPQREIGFHTLQEEPFRPARPNGKPVRPKRRNTKPVKY